MAHEGDMRALIDEGSNHFKNKRYKPALEQYTRAMRRCPCYAKADRQRCCCRDYEKAMLEDKSFLDEVEKACQCSAQGQDKCDNEMHIHALDSRAAVFEKMDHIDRAKKDASWILELAPGLPQGYLRLGSIMRRRKNNKMAWLIFSAGIEAVKNASVPPHPRIKNLYDLRQPLHHHYSRQDMIQMPVEIVHMIVQLLDFPSRLRCIAVSKTWRTALTGYAFRWAWRNLDFPVRLSRSRTSVTTGALKSILGLSGNDVREISIPDANRFRLNTKKLSMILLAARDVERFDLQEPFESLAVDPDLLCLPKLTHLTTGMSSINRVMILNAASSLTYLHLIDPVPRIVPDELELPVLKNLKYFRLTKRHSRSPIWSIDLSKYLPNIEQVFIENVAFGLGSELMGSIDRVLGFCSKLKVVIYRPPAQSTTLLAQYGLKSLLSLLPDSQLEYLEHNVPNMRLGSSMPVITPYDEHSDELPYFLQLYDKLRILRTDSFIFDPPWGERLLKGTVDSKMLNSLDLLFPEPGLNEPAGRTSLVYLASWDWIRGAESIKSLGFSGFDFGPEYMRDSPLLAFAKTFPNLESVELSSSHHSPEYVSFVAYILLKEVKTLKRLYVDITGEALYSLRDAAASVGVTFNRRRNPENSTRAWPVPLEPNQMLRSIQA